MPAAVALARWGRQQGRHQRHQRPQRPQRPQLVGHRSSASVVMVRDHARPTQGAKRRLSINKTSFRSAGPRPSPTPACARRSWTGSPSVATASRPAPTPTGWPAPAANAPPPPPPTPSPEAGACVPDDDDRKRALGGWGQISRHAGQIPPQVEARSDQTVTVGPPQVDIARPMRAARCSRWGFNGS